jgi:hypothetical protein
VLLVRSSLWMELPFLALSICLFCNSIIMCVPRCDCLIGIHGVKSDYFCLPSVLEDFPLALFWGGFLFVY